LVEKLEKHLQLQGPKLQSRMDMTGVGVFSWD